MNPEVQKLRDELLYEQVKGSRSLALGLSIVYGACVLITLGFAVGIVALNKGFKAFFIDLGFILGSAAAAYGWWTSYKESCAALDEIGDDPTGISTCKTYSISTAKVIGFSRLSKSELRQQWIAYGIIALTMLLFGALFVLLVMSYMDEPIFVFCAAFMLGGGVLLSSMAIRSFREWLIARRLEKLEASEGAEGPAALEAPMPETPAASEEPAAPATPAVPETPAAPEAPATPAAPEAPATFEVE